MMDVISIYENYSYTSKVAKILYVQNTPLN